jgi:osmotically-inducible protein OsmY
MSPDVRASVGHETESAFATVTNYIAQVARDNIGTLVAHDVNEIEAGVEADNCSDANLAQSVRSAIERNAFLPAGKVRSVVRNGWLILVGEVEGPIQKRMAEDAIRGLDGIRGVSNNILIESDALAQRVGQKIDEAFVRSALISAHHISITACDHKIILSGCVRSLVESEEAEMAAWAVPGVAQVVNRLRSTAA